MKLFENLRQPLKIEPVDVKGKENDYTNQSDEWLVNQWVSRENSEACTEIYRRYKEKIFNFLHSKLSQELAEDATQECFKVFIEKPQQFANTKNIKNLFFTIAYNYAKRYMRKASISLDEKVESGFEFADQTTTIVDALIWKEKRHLVGKFLGELDDRYKDIMYLRVEEDFMPADIADILKMDVKKVKNLLNYAINYIKKRFMDTGK